MMTDAKYLWLDSYKDAVKAIHSTLDIREVLELLVGKVVQVMKVKGGSLYLFDPERRTLELVSSHGLSGKYIGKGPVEADQSIAQTMEGKTVWIPEAMKDPRVQYRKEAIEEGIYGILSVPLSIKGQVVGALRLYTPGPRTFLKEEIDFIEGLAEMGTIAIENARRYESIRKDYEYVLNDIFYFYGYRRSI
jgi:signal transduction protein with GAF and PtsI domain